MLVTLSEIVMLVSQLQFLNAEFGIIAASVMVTLCKPTGTPSKI